jgi:hypothetical protein
MSNFKVTKAALTWIMGMTDLCAQTDRIINKEFKHNKK